MPEASFAVGSRVRVIDYRRIHKGMTGCVRELKPAVSNIVHIVDFDGKGNGFGAFSAKELELVPEQQ